MVNDGEKLVRLNRTLGIVNQAVEFVALQKFYWLSSWEKLHPIYTLT